MSEQTADTNTEQLSKPSINSNNASVSTTSDTQCVKLSQTGDQTTKVANKALKAPKNWDKICKELEEEDKDEEGVDDMFKKLYSQADDDTRRAMMKSMYESKGTTLSMNWKEVGPKFVKPYEDKDKDKDLDDDEDDD